MKIALSLESFDPHRGSMEATTFQLADRLLRLSHDVHVVAQDFSEAGLGIPIVPHRIRATRSPMRRAARAEAKLRGLNPDVIHDMGVTWYADVFTSPVGSRIGMWQRQLAGTAWWRRPAKRLALRLRPLYRRQAELACRQLEQSDSIVVASSEMVAHDYQSIHNVASSRIRLVYHGVDIKKFSPHIRKLRWDTTRRKLGVDANDLLLLTGGDDLQQEALITLLRAMRRLRARQTGLQLVLIAGKRTASHQKLADRFGLAEQVKLIGPVSDPIPYYAAADVFVHPTLYDPCSLSLLEAAACGLPSITTQHNGVADLLTEGSDSFILQRNSAAELAKRIDLLRDPSRREKMGRAARRTAMRHTLERSVDKILQIYEEIVELQAEEDRREQDILALPHGTDRDSTSRRAA